MGAVRLYFIGTKTFKTKDGPKEKTVIHYEMNGTRYAFASDRADFVKDMGEVRAVIAKPTEQNPDAQTSINASFAWTKGGPLTVTL